jgi:hypothetical protein
MRFVKDEVAVSTWVFHECGFLKAEYETRRFMGESGRSVEVHR